MINKDAYSLKKKKELKKKRKVIAPTWLFPINAEREYTRALISLNKFVKAKIKEIIFPMIPVLVQEVARKTPMDRADDFLDTLKTLIISIRAAIENKLFETYEIANSVARQINVFNQAQFQKMNERAFGIDIYRDEPWLADQLKLFASQNAQLIESLPDNELDKVAQTIELGLQQGQSIKTIESELQKRFAITDRHARLIARDQTAKLNAAMKQYRQQEAGITRYIWRTAGDQRVRESHRKNNGKIFEWDKPPKETGHPSQDYNCRCIAEPYLEDVMEID